MLLILNNNIIKYVLNEYLEYLTDINKLKQLFHEVNMKFDIKVHLKHQMNQENEKYKELYLDNELIQSCTSDCFGKDFEVIFRANHLTRKEFYTHNKIRLIYNYIKIPNPTGKDKLIRHGFSKDYDVNGNLISNKYYCNGKCISDYSGVEKSDNDSNSVYLNNVDSESEEDD
jgi:hypothetical protein